MGKKVTVCFAVILVLSPIFTGLTFAQVDPEKALIGKWEGQPKSQRTRERTTGVNSVKAIGNGELAWLWYDRQR